MLILLPRPTGTPSKIEGELEPRRHCGATTRKKLTSGLTSIYGLETPLARKVHAPLSRKYYHISSIAPLSIHHQFKECYQKNKQKIGQ